MISRGGSATADSRRLRSVPRPVALRFHGQGSPLLAIRFLASYLMIGASRFISPRRVICSINNRRREAISRHHFGKSSRRRMAVRRHWLISLASPPH